VEKNVLKFVESKIVDFIMKKYSLFSLALRMKKMRNLFFLKIVVILLKNKDSYNLFKIRDHQLLSNIANVLVVINKLKIAVEFKMKSKSSQEKWIL